MEEVRKKISLSKHGTNDASIVADASFVSTDGTVHWRTDGSTVDTPSTVGSFDRLEGKVVERVPTATVRSWGAVEERIGVAGRSSSSMSSLQVIRYSFVKAEVRSHCSMGRSE